MKRTRRFLPSLVIVAASSSWLACAGLLGIDDPRIAPDAGRDGAGAIDGAPGVDGAVGDAGADVALDVAPTGFALSLNPGYLALDPDASANVTVTVVRGTSFTDAVEVTAQDLGPDLSTNPAAITIPSSETSGSFTFKAAAGAATADLAVKLIGTSKANSSISANVVLPARIGLLLATPTSSTKLTLPPWAVELDVLVWGAGGGAGGKLPTPNGDSWGGPGGGGGFVTARIPVDPSVTLEIEIGTGGAGATSSNGGGGGGYSSIKQGAAFLVVAGGGGGGGGGQSRNNSGQCVQESFNLQGVGGGGGDAEKPQIDPARSATMTAAGTAATGSGASNGGSLAGGDGAIPITIAGAPGGGRGGTGYTTCQINGGGGGGGGGGAGWFGGAGGSGRDLAAFTFPSGGGGGSGMVVAGAKSVGQKAAAYYQPPGPIDPACTVDAGKGGAQGSSSAPAGSGNPGCVIVRFVAP